MTDRNSIIGKVDWPILLMYFALVTIGWLSIYSAGMSEGHHAIYDISHFCGKQMMWIGISLAAGLVILILDAKLIEAFAFWFYAIVMFLLVVVLVYGKATNGATSWIDFGGFKFQPSEFAKLGTALAVACLLGKLDTDLQQRKTRLKVYALILAPAALVLAVPGPSVFPSGEPGVSGDFWGSQEGCQGSFRPSGRNRSSAPPAPRSRRATSSRTP